MNIKTIITWFGQFKYEAKRRGIKFEISKEEVLELFKKQKYRCKLSGIRLKIYKGRQKRRSTASIDRINSKKGYTSGNIQIVHKKINMMKQQYSQYEFVRLCKRVAIWQV